MSKRDYDLYFDLYSDSDSEEEFGTSNASDFYPPRNPHANVINNHDSMFTDVWQFFSDSFSATYLFFLGVANSVSSAFSSTDHAGLPEVLCKRLSVEQTQSPSNEAPLPAFQANGKDDASKRIGHRVAKASFGITGLLAGAAVALVLMFTPLMPAAIFIGAVVSLLVVTGAWKFCDDNYPDAKGVFFPLRSKNSEDGLLPSSSVKGHRPG